MNLLSPLLVKLLAGLALVAAIGCGVMYVRAVRAERLPAALVQAQRDYFGAHNYLRVDREGSFHTLWSGDRTEVDGEGVPVVMPQPAEGDPTEETAR